MGWVNAMIKHRISRRTAKRKLLMSYDLTGSSVDNRKRKVLPGYIYIENQLYYSIKELNKHGNPLNRGFLVYLSNIYRETWNHANHLNQIEKLISIQWVRGVLDRAKCSRRRICGEVCSADRQAAVRYCSGFHRKVESIGDEDLIFNFDETGLMWKQLQTYTYCINGNSPNGWKMPKNRFTVGLCTNMSGKLVLKPLVIVKGGNVNARLYTSSHGRYDVFCSANGWMTSDLFKMYITVGFCCRFAIVPFVSHLFS